MSLEKRLNRFIMRMRERICIWIAEKDLTPGTPCPKCGEVDWHAKLSSHILRADVILFRLERLYKCALICQSCWHSVGKRGMRSYARARFADYERWVNERYAARKEE